MSVAAARRDPTCAASASRRCRRLRAIRPGLAVAATIGCIAAASAGARASEAEFDETCTSSWSIEGLHVGMTAAEAGKRAAELGGKLRREQPTRKLWRLPSVGDAGDRQILVDLDANAERVVSVTLFAGKPDRALEVWLEQLTSRWGPPLVERHAVLNDKTGLLTEGSVWIDRACDIKATLLGRRERSLREFITRSVAVRLERSIDPVGHLEALRDQTREISGR